MQYGEFIAQNRSVQHNKSSPIVGSKGHGHKKICTCDADLVGFNPV